MGADSLQVSLVSVFWRGLVLVTQLLLVGCISSQPFPAGAPLPQPQPLPLLRAPQVGQEWTYVKRDVFNGKTLGLITERIAKIGSSIVIDRVSADGLVLPSEIQSSWGMALTDPEWPRVLHFNPPVPLWPQELSSKWNKQIETHYTLGDFSDSRLGWQEYMSAQGWEKITVPAGTFVALRFQALINYESDDANKVDCIHKETVWFAPEIGRWVAREASGSYQIQGQVGAVIEEGSYQWQLTAYK